MNLFIADSWSEYELLDSGNSKRLERFGMYIVDRPDPQTIWQPTHSAEFWQKADAVFERKSEDKGLWNIKNKLPQQWELPYRNIKLLAKLSPFKHTGIFPEQTNNWDFIEKKIKQKEKDYQPYILNLFGYTGGATLVAAAAGAKVTHVDASKPSTAWARENQTASGLGNAPIRWILDDAMKFVQREIKRGVKYDGIIMDPPAFGHGITGQMWKFNEDFPKLMQACTQLLVDNPLFVIVNAYAISASAIMLENVMHDFLEGGIIESGELCLKQTDSDKLLSTGLLARWHTNP